MENEELKPCPFCGTIPLLEWEKWSEISENSGTYKIYANHKPGCFIRCVDTPNITGKVICDSKKFLIDCWNRRVEQCD